MADYTISELILSRAAKEIKDGEMVVIGQGIAMGAGVLAKRTHAPNLVILTEAGLLGIEPFKVPIHIADPSCTRGFTYSCDMTDIFTTVLNRGYVDVSFLGVGQIDKFGNMNSSYIGDSDNYEFRMTGAGGAPEFVGYSSRTILTMLGGEFVEKLDYFTSPGYLYGGNSRYEEGMPEDSGPHVLISNKGVFKFEKESKEIYLAEIHPGVELDDIKASVPWDLKITENLTQTPLPTKEEIDIVRNFAPEISMGRALQMETLINRVFQLLEKAQAGSVQKP
ncbi:glutaconate CoA-transferase [bacterium]|nr:glutaconate CoA-transferase [bacterium]